jgi:hypothetical protein
MDNKKLKEMVAAWCKAAAKDLPQRTAPGNRAVTWEANVPAWWSHWNGVRCIGLTVRGYVNHWAGTIRLNLIITDNSEYVVTSKPGDYGYLRDEAVEAFRAKIPATADPLVTHLERWKQAMIADIQKLEFSDVQFVHDEGKEPKAFFTIRHPEIPRLGATVDLDNDSFDIKFAPRCAALPISKMLADTLRRVERAAICIEE